MRLKASGKIVVILLVLGIVFGGYRIWKGPDAFSSPFREIRNRSTVSRSER